MKKKNTNKVTQLPSPNPTLSQEELQEFHLRKQTLDNARCTAIMVEESFETWFKKIAAKYNLSGMKFEINPKTGDLSAVGEKQNG